MSAIWLKRFVAFSVATAHLSAVRDATLLGLGGGVASLPWISTASAVIGVGFLNPWAARRRGSALNALRAFLRAVSSALLLFAAVNACDTISVDARRVLVGVLCAILSNVGLLGSSLLWIAARCDATVAATSFTQYATACTVGMVAGFGLSRTLSLVLQWAALRSSSSSGGVCALFACSALLLEGVRSLLQQDAQDEEQQQQQQQQPPQQEAESTATSSTATTDEEAAVRTSRVCRAASLTTAYTCLLILLSFSMGYNTQMLRSEKLAAVGHLEQQSGARAAAAAVAPTPPHFAGSNDDDDDANCAVLLRSLGSLARINGASSAWTLAAQLALAAMARRLLSVPSLLMLLPSVDLIYAAWRVTRGQAASDDARLRSIAALQTVRGVVSYAFLKAAREELYLVLPKRLARRSKLLGAEAARRLAAPAAALIASPTIFLAGATTAWILWLFCGIIFRRLRARKGSKENDRVHI